MGPFWPEKPYMSSQLVLVTQQTHLIGLFVIESNGASFGTISCAYSFGTSSIFLPFLRIGTLDVLSLLCSAGHAVIRPSFENLTSAGQALPSLCCYRTLLFASSCPFS